MGLFLKKFENHTQYENYINGSGAILPNVSICTTEGDVHYNPYVEPIETRVVAKYNVTDTINPTKILYKTSGFSEIEIDGVVQPNVVSAYTFDTIGEHIVKYTLTDATSISSSVFTECNSLTSIVIPNSVTSIGQGAFYFCSGITSIDIPDSVTSIGSDVFCACRSLTRLNSDVDGVFNLPSGVTSIGYSTFASCTSLTSIEIPSGVTSINYSAFQSCTSLTSIVCNATTAPTIEHYTFHNIKTNGTLTVPIGSTGYDSWMSTHNYYLGYYNWIKVEQ